MKDNIRTIGADSILEESDEVDEALSPFDTFASAGPFLVPAIDSPLAEDSDLSLATFCDTCNQYDWQPLTPRGTLKTTFMLWVLQ